MLIHEDKSEKAKSFSIQQEQSIINQARRNEWRFYFTSPRNPGYQNSDPLNDDSFCRFAFYTHNSILRPVSGGEGRQTQSLPSQEGQAMFLKKFQAIRLEPEYLTVIPLERSSGSGGEFKVFYLKSPLIRDTVRSLLNAIVENFSSELFSDLCMQCGNCCRNRTVAVTSRTIEQIAHYLCCYDDELFRSEYIEKGQTWNDRDGVLARCGDSCVFLEEVSADRSRCRIYPLRPSQCVSFSSAGDSCRKDRGDLISHIEEVMLHSDNVEVKRSGNRIFSLPIDLPAITSDLTNLLSLLIPLAESRRGSDRDVQNDLNDRAAEAKMLFYREGLTEALKEKIVSLADDMERLSEIETESGAALDTQTDYITAQIEHLIDCIDEESEKLKYECTMRTFERLHLFPECLEVTIHSDTHDAPVLIIYRDHPKLLHLVQEMLNRIVSCADQAVLSALTDCSNLCIHCGECCRGFTGEILPGELGIIAAHLAISVKEMWNTLLEPGVSTWNGHTAIFKSSPGHQTLSSENDEYPHSSEEQPLQPLQCPFLERRDDSLFYCSIYEVRPLACRRKNACAEMCSKSISLNRPELLIDRINSIEVHRDKLSLILEKQPEKARVVYLREYGKELAVVEELKSEVHRITSLQQSRHFI